MVIEHSLHAHHEGHVIIQIYPDQSLRWLLIDSEGVVIERRFCADFSQLPKRNVTEHCVVLLPGNKIYSEIVSLPNTSKKNVLKALPFLLEDKLLGDIGSLYLIAHRIGNTQQYFIAAIDRSLFQHYFELIKQHELFPQAILPDYFALPYQEQLSIKIVDGWASVRNGENQGFTVPEQHLSFALLLKEQGMRRERPLRCKLQMRDESKHWVVELKKHYEVEILQEEHFDLNLFSSKPMMNFLQGPYYLKSTSKRPHSFWRYSGFAFAVWLSIIFGVKMTEWMVYRHNNNILNQKIMVITQSLFPGQTITDPKLFLQHTLDNLAHRGQDDTFIHLLLNIGTALHQAQGVELHSLGYEEAQLTVVINATQLSAIEKFSRAVEEQGIIIRQNQITTGEKNITGQFILTRS